MRKQLHHWVKLTCSDPAARWISLLILAALALLLSSCGTVTSADVSGYTDSKSWRVLINHVDAGGLEP